MKLTVQDGTKKTYDFDRYREMFGKRMLNKVTVIDLHRYKKDQDLTYLSNLTVKMLFVAMEQLNYIQSIGMIRRL